MPSSSGTGRQRPLGTVPTRRRAQIIFGFLCSCGAGLSRDPFESTSGTAGHGAVSGSGASGGGASGGGASGGGVAGGTVGGSGASGGRFSSGGDEVRGGVSGAAGSAGFGGKGGSGGHSNAGQGGAAVTGGMQGDPPSSGFGGGLTGGGGGAGLGAGADGQAGNGGADGGESGSTGGGTAGGLGIPLCSPFVSFAPARLVQGLEASGFAFAQLSPDERTIYLAQLIEGEWKIVSATRENVDEPFPQPEIIAALDSPYIDGSPSVTVDGRTMFFETHRRGRYEIFVSTRSSTNEKFGTPVPLAGLDALGDANCCPYISADGGTLYFASYDEYTPTLYRADWNGESVEGARPLAAVDTRDYNSFPVVSSDELVLYFTWPRDAEGNEKRDQDIWVAQRSARSEAFGGLRNVVELSTEMEDSPNWLSFDGCRLYFERHDPRGIHSLWVAERASLQAP